MRQLEAIGAAGGGAHPSSVPPSAAGEPAAGPAAGRSPGGGRRTAAPGEAVVRCFDLDAGLIRTDVLIEHLLLLLKRRPYLLLLLPVWLWAGRARLQAEIARRQPVDAPSLPLDAGIADQLAREAGLAGPVAVVTRLPAAWAEPIARHLAPRAIVVASGDDVLNTALARTARLVSLFGDGGFRWIGPAAPARAPTGLRPYIRAMRPHQWLKNLLVFVPILLAVKSITWDTLANGVVAFLAFSLAASSVYLLNDLTDLADDRRHPTKCRRPIAAGLVPAGHALALVALLLGLAVALSLALLPRFFTLVLLAYYVTTLAYSFGLKRTMLFDVITLAGLYTLRIIAGSAAIAIPRSFWLLAFSVFLFFSLALVKRYVEIKDIVESRDGASAQPERIGGNGRLAGRGYRADDLETLSQFGIASGMMAVLVLALYIDSPVVKALYHTPELIWLLCPLTLYLICRFWILARRGEMHDDPIVFAARDWRSQMVLVAGAMLLLLAAVA